MNIKTKITSCLMSFFLIGFVTPFINPYPRISQANSVVSMQQPASSFVRMDVTVTTARGRYVQGLNKTDFFIYDNGVLQDIASFSNDEPANIFILVDVSRSISRASQRNVPARFKSLKDSLKQLIQAGNGSNEYSVAAFNERTQVLLDSLPGSSALAELDNLDSLQLQGYTALFDACSFAIDKLSRSRHSKRSLIVFSDWQDGGSMNKADKLERQLKESGVILYAINPQNVYESMKALLPEAPFERWASMSGGLSFRRVGEKELPNRLLMIGQDLRNKYNLGFKASHPQDGGKWHEIKMNIVLPPKSTLELKDIRVRSQQGYYANKKTH